MSNIVYLAWVKNVYSLRTDQGVSSVRSYTDTYPTLLSPTLSANNYLLLPSTTPTLLTPFSTVFSVVLYLLNPMLYLFSTPPTITKTKEK